jgi:flavin-dependent dehydrogenase
MPDTPRTNFDAIVIGAGLAGSTVATLLARGGWSVALIERQGFPRRKVCGECVAASNLPLLETLGVGDQFHAHAGPALRQVTLLHETRSVTADLPAANHDRFPWGGALGRETLDTLLLERARLAGATIFQPWSVQNILGSAGAWHCGVRAVGSSVLLRLGAKVVIDAHGSWEDLPTVRSQRKLSRSAEDLFAFKANFKGSTLSEGVIHVLGLDGGYGGMVVADGGVTTIACCIRRDRLTELRSAAPGLSAGGAVQAWLTEACPGVRHALRGAVRDGPWLTSGPLDPGARITANDTIFRIGNAAGEAHPILGEGMSMALQSAAMLASHLLRQQATAPVPDEVQQAHIAHQYAVAWRKEFVPRMRLAAIFAHLMMRPASAALLLRLFQICPALLTRGARWGGKVRLPVMPQVATALPALNATDACAHRTLKPLLEDAI